MLTRENLIFDQKMEQSLVDSSAAGDSEDESYREYYWGLVDEYANREATEPGRDNRLLLALNGSAYDPNSPLGNRILGHGDLIALDPTFITIR
jgi:hypothetical protein